MAICANDDVFEFDENGNLTLKGVCDQNWPYDCDIEENGRICSDDNDGLWVKPVGSFRSAEATIRWVDQNGDPITAADPAALPGYAENEFLTLAAGSITLENDTCYPLRTEVWVGGFSTAFFFPTGSDWSVGYYMDTDIHNIGETADITLPDPGQLNAGGHRFRIPNRGTNVVQEIHSWPIWAWFQRTRLVQPGQAITLYMESQFIAHTYVPGSATAANSLRHPALYPRLLGQPVTD